MNGNVSQKRIIRIQIPYKNKEKKIMKITVITGSPRKHGNSFAMTEAFIEEAIKCGNLTSNLLKLKLTEQLRKCTFVLLA